MKTRHRKWILSSVKSVKRRERTHQKNFIVSVELHMMNLSELCCSLFHYCQLLCYCSCYTYSLFHSLLLYFRFYIGCDQCQDWFHGACVGVSQSVADKMDTYICPNCEKQGASTDNTLSEAIIKPNHWSALRAVLQSLQVNSLLSVFLSCTSALSGNYALTFPVDLFQQHKMSKPFLKPVSISEFPNYYKLVKEPMGE